MMTEQGNRARLFAISFAAIVATSFCFVLRAMVVDAWGVEFALSETQKGELLGVGLWPFAISIVLLALIIDRIGFRTGFYIAAFCQGLGLAVILSASGYWGLYVGTFLMALGNGAVEASANPLIATVYAEDKPQWLNRLHAAWPGGLILGGVLAMALGDAVEWRAKVGLMAVPIAVYLFLLLRVRFPVSERVASGISYQSMLREAGFGSAFVIIALMMIEIGRVFALTGFATVSAIALLTAIYALYSRSFGRPLYIILVLLMIPLATTELSTDSWISSLMEPEMRALGLQAGWVLVYTSAVVFVVRLYAGPIIRRLTPPGALAMASALAAVGLYWLAGSSGVALLVAATLYGIGKSFFWGTSLAIGSEQFPRGGALAINIMAGAGMLAAGIVGSVLLGALQDDATARGMAAHDRARGSVLAQTYLTDEKRSVFGAYRSLDTARLAKAAQHDRETIARIEADGKQGALRSVALLPLMTLAIYLCLMLFFRARGGYRPVSLSAGAERP